MISSTFVYDFADVKNKLFLKLAKKKIKYLCHNESQDDEELKLKTAN